MTDIKPQLTPAELVQAFADLFNAIDPETPEEIDAVLRIAGYDPVAVGERMEKYARRELCKALGLSPKLLGTDEENIDG